MSTIPKEAIDLQTTKGFDKEFFARLGRANISQKEAYEQVEELYKSYWGKTKYSSFESYRQARNRRYKQQR